MSKKITPCRITKIRLINFHNFSNETIDIPNGGHLFLLGDNGSGKTTVLDAIHYVLTAGEHMEFNAAARVAGNKQTGRRVQGIITRFNVDSGYLRPAGGVTYAAIEISGENGRQTSVAIGMSVNSPDDQLSRWGVIGDLPLEELPLLVRDAGGERPRTKEEMRQALGGTGYYGQPQSFLNQLAERFLGGRAMLEDFCRFLAMGKAYREIASHTSDYQELFKRLLPESGKEIFEQIIISLRTLDESRGDLEHLHEKLAYLKRLVDIMAEIRAASERAAAFDAVAVMVRLAQLEQDIAADRDSLVAFAQQRQELEKELNGQRGLELEFERRIGDLKARDAAGALTRERELRGKIDQQEGRLTLLDAEAETNRRKQQQENDELARLTEGQRERLSELLKKLPDKSLQTGLNTAPLVAALEKNLRHEADSEKELEKALALLLEHLRKYLTDNEKSGGVLEHGITRLTEQENELAQTEKALAESREATPEYNAFSLLLDALEHDHCNCTPLYMGLEWRSALNEEMRNLIEEFIGEELLSILVVDEREYDRTAETVFGNFPGHRLAVATLQPESPREFREWAQTVFDVTRCNPAVLDILLRELAAKCPPEFTAWRDVDIAAFRSHRRALSGTPARYIGAEARKNEQQRKLAGLRDDLKEIRAQLKTEDGKLKEVKSKLRLGKNLEALLTQMQTALNAYLARCGQLRLKIEHLGQTGTRLTQELTSLRDSLERDRQTCRELQAIIGKENLAGLEDELKKVEVLLDQCRKVRDGLNEAGGKLKDRRENTEKHIVSLTEALASGRGEYELKLKALSDRFGASAPETRVEQLRREHHIRLEPEAVKLAGEQRGEVRLKQEMLKLRIAEIGGVDYGFSYDQENMQLFSRNGITAEALEESLRKQIDEQSRIINEQTAEMFKKLIMDSMIKTLWEKVHRLEQMNREINRLLGSRRFGNNTYRIHVKPRPECERLVNLVKSFTAYNPEVMAELEHFFQDYKADLLNTAPGEIPPLLDYRNWFSYEMEVRNVAGDGKVMDQRVKSIGSGGEQAVPNYLLVLTIAHFMFTGAGIRLCALLFDEAFYGIDAQRRDQLMGFASDLGLQLFVASPDQDGVKDEIACSTSLLVVKDVHFDVHLYPYHWNIRREKDLFIESDDAEVPPRFNEEL